MLICNEKTNFIIHFFIKILHFKESCNLIGWQHLAHNLRTKISTLVFILDYFQEKLTWQNFSKITKNFIFRLFWALFGLIWAKINFPEKRLCQFLNIPIIYHCVKNQKKLMSHSWQECLTVGWIDRQQLFYRTFHRIQVQLLKQL